MMEIAAIDRAKHTSVERVRQSPHHDIDELQKPWAGCAVSKSDMAADRYKAGSAPTHPTSGPGQIGTLPHLLLYGTCSTYPQFIIPCNMYRSRPRPTVPDMMCTCRFLLQLRLELLTMTLLEILPYHFSSIVYHGSVLDRCRNIDRGIIIAFERVLYQFP